MRRSLSALALGLCLATGTAAAQELRAGLLVPWPTRTDAMHTAVFVATPRVSGPHELRAHVRRYWPAQELNVAHAVSLAGRARTATVPIPFGHNDDGVATLLPERAQTAVGAGNPGNPRNGTPRFVAVLGLGAGRAADLDDGSSESETVAAVVARSPEGAPLFAPLPLAWGGAQAIVTDGATLADAPADALASLADWVHAGGVLAVSARDGGDLRQPWMRSLLGDAELDASGHARGANLIDAHTPGGQRFGAARAVGLGAAVVLDGDLSLEGDPAAREALRAFRDAMGVGGGLVAPGDLALWRRMDETSVQRRVRGPSNLRPALVPIAVALALYVVAVGVVLSRNRARKNPLRVFVRVPAAGLAILAAVFGLSVALRAHRSAARVACVWDIGSGSRRAVLRRFGVITAARPQSFSLRPRPGEVALVRGSAASAAGTLRWDGTRLAVEGARLGLWETALLYTEGVVDAGGAIDVEVRDGSVVVTNGSALTLRDATLLAPGMALRFPPIAPGARVEAGYAARESLHPGTALVDGALRWRGAALVATVLDEVLGDLRAAQGPQLVARTDLDAATRAMLSAAGFPVESGEAMVRVAVNERPSPRVFSAGMPRSRVGARTWSAYDEGPPRVSPPPLADAGGDAP